MPDTDDTLIDRARSAETDELVGRLRDRTIQLHAALLRTSQQLAEVRQQLAEYQNDDDTEDEGETTNGV